MVTLREVVKVPREVLNVPREVLNVPRELAIAPRDVVAVPREVVIASREVVIVARGPVTTPRALATVLRGPVTVARLVETFDLPVLFAMVVDLALGAALGVSFLLMILASSLGVLGESTGLLRGGRTGIHGILIASGVPVDPVTLTDLERPGYSALCRSLELGEPAAPGNRSRGIPQPAGKIVGKSHDRDSLRMLHPESHP